MKFAIQNLVSIRDWQTAPEVYANALEECRLADTLGFDTVWLAEHHFSSYGLLPSLGAFAGAVARETRRARIGTAVVIAPFAHPIRIAEEFAMVDILSEGRLEFGLGRGYQPKEFVGLGVSMERTRERFDEALEVIRRAWTEPRVTFEGEFYRLRDLPVLPKPVQRPHPPLWTAAVSPDTYALAGRRGLKILTSPAFTPFDILRKNFDAYRAAWRETHGDERGAEICVNKIIHVADSAREARENLREPIRWFFQTQADLISDPDGVPPEQYRFYRRVRENLLALSEEKALEQAAIAGDPEEVADRLRQHHEALGVTYVMGAFSRGGLAQDKVRRSLVLFAEKVMPRLAG
jgi:natural product biosynthesis luciferase-like monooxygenase protein